MELDVTLRKGFRLGEWEVRPIEGLLSSALGTRHLQPKSMDVLVSLAAQSGQVLTRDELIEKVWSSHAVSDEPLTRCIHEIRRALGDPPGEARYIRTIPKRGYQLLPAIGELPEPVAELVAPIEVDCRADTPSFTHDITVSEMPGDAPAAAKLFWEVTRQRVLWVGAIYAALAWIFVELIRYAELQTAAGRAFPDWLVPVLVVVVLLGFPIAIFFAWVRQIAADHPARSRAPEFTLNNLAALLWSRRGIDVVLVTLVITGLAGFAVDFRPPVAAEVSSSAQKSIAVIPFTQAAGESDVAWLGSGLAEDLSIRLRDYGALHVSERGQPFSAAAVELDAQQLGQQLNVQYLLEGVVVTGETGLRLNLRVTDTATGFEVWSGYFSQPMAAVATIQQQVVTEVAGALQVEDSFDHESALSWSPDIRGDAYASYLQGLFHLANADDQDSAARAAAWFDRAYAEDQRLVSAKIASCRAYTRELQLSDSAWAHGKANQVCARTVKRLPKNAAAHLALADYFFIAGFPRDAIDQYEWVTARQPDNADAWRGLGLARASERIAAGAEQALRAALTLRPGDARNQAAYAQFLLDEGRYTEAVDVARQLVQLDRESSPAYAIFAEALFDTGKFSAAIQAARRAVAFDLSNRPAIMTIAGSYYYLGNYARAVDIYQQAARLNPDDPLAAGAIANALRQIDQADAEQHAQIAYLHARDLAERVMDTAGGDVQTMLALAFYCAMLEDTQCAEKYQSVATAEGLDNDEDFYWSALVHARLGNIAAATASAQAALKHGYPQALILGEPLLADLWSQQGASTVQLSSATAAEL